MHIQWYPGHMTKAVRMMEENVKLVDAVLYMLDARAVRACFNPTFFRLAGDKPIVFVVNKSDLVTDKDLKSMVGALREEGHTVVSANSLGGIGVKDVVRTLKLSLSDKVERYRMKGIKKTLRAMVLGVPNSGKSTLVNSLCGSKRAMTGNRPGVTRGKQWVALGDYVELLDTPGTLMPSFDNQEYARHLCYIGCVDENIVDLVELVSAFIEDVRVISPGAIATRFGIDESMKPYEVLDAIGRKRGCMVKGGDVDVERAARVLLDDFRKGKLGKIALEI